MSVAGVGVQAPDPRFVINNYVSMNKVQSADNANFGSNHGQIDQGSLSERRTSKLPAVQSGVTAGKSKVSQVAQVGGGDGGPGQKSALRFFVLPLLSLLRTNFLLAIPPKWEDSQQIKSTDSIPVSGSSRSAVTAGESEFEMMAMDADPPIPSQPALHEIYVRTLLRNGYGLPCWEPSSGKPTAQPKGVVPGDVGIYTVKSGFKKTFNLWDDDAVVQRKSKRWNRGSPCQIPERDIETRSDVLQRGEALFDGVRMSQRNSPEDVEYSFSCDVAPGAILALTSSADEEESERITELERYIKHHAKAIFKHASDIRPLGRDDSLYIITGCTKSDSWAMAVYAKCEPGQSALQLVPERSCRVGEASGYKWTSQDLGSSRFRRSGRYPYPRVKDQALFLQGFKLAFSQRFRSQMEDDDSGDDDSEGRTDGSEGDADKANEHHNPDGHDELNEPDEAHGPDGPDNSGGSPNELKDSSLPSDQSSLDSSGPSGMLSLSLNSRALLASVDEDVKCSPFPNVTRTSYHPSDVINACFLRQTDCDVAMTHDDSWRFLFKAGSTRDDQGSMAPDGMQTQIDSSGNCTFCVQDGVAFFLPADGCTRRKTPDAPCDVPVAPIRPAWGNRIQTVVEDHQWPSGSVPEPLPGGLYARKPHLANSDDGAAHGVHNEVSHSDEEARRSGSHSHSKEGSPTSGGSLCLRKASTEGLQGTDGAHATAHAESKGKSPLNTMRRASGSSNPRRSQHKERRNSAISAEGTPRNYPSISRVRLSLSAPNIATLEQKHRSTPLNNGVHEQNYSSTLADDEGMHPWSISSPKQKYRDPSTPMNDKGTDPPPSRLVMGALPPFFIPTDGEAGWPRLLNMESPPLLVGRLDEDVGTSSTQARSQAAPTGESEGSRSSGVYGLCRKIANRLIRRLA